MYNNLFIRIWDVQHGSAAYVRTPEGRHIAIDLGVGDFTGNDAHRAGGDESFSPLKFLRANGVQQLDRVVITHPHTDHVDDIFEFDNMSPKTLLFAKHLTDDEVLNGNQRRERHILNEYLKITHRYDKPVTGGSVEAERPTFDFASFHPVGCAASNLNNQSIVVFLTYAGSTICIPGDPEGAAWRELLKQPRFIDYLKQTDILVASHHGRESGYCEDIFEHLKPKLVIISDGQSGTTCVREKYYQKASGWEVGSHSSAELTTRYCLTTRRDGSINIEFGNGYMSVKTE